MCDVPTRINGVVDDTSVANEFMIQFGSVCFDSSLENEAKEHLNIVKDNQIDISPETNIDVVNVELIDKCI